MASGYVTPMFKLTIQKRKDENQTQANVGKHVNKQ